ncbi:hypothetical protein DLAC_09769 [Tieghemostelium lacteum]|uniref:Uncharacterized protein n=1 Tax=Tieghemostelium lacteum TaxID=361077 RepID=A0A151Z762_TIELA|nr:hypothetical protein DLAC_09769 [Tieghemostelium lacteum]|eukprot:KYQ89799.1 hypothetical protein DLAC_09769 [Tieghemostelium lacteum]
MSIKTTFLIFNENTKDKENIDPLTGINVSTSNKKFNSSSTIGSKKRVPLRDITPIVTRKTPSSSSQKKIKTCASGNYMTSTNNSNNTYSKITFNNTFGDIKSIR